MIMANELNNRETFGANSHNRRGRGRFVRGGGGGGKWRPYFYIRRGSKRDNSTFTNRNTTTNESNITSNTNVPGADGASNNCEDFFSIPIDDNPLQYPGWRLYFPNENFNENGDLSKYIKSFENHFLANINDYNFQCISENLWFLLNIEYLLKDQQFLSKWNNFKHYLIEYPEKVWACSGVAMHKLVTLAVYEMSAKETVINNYYRPTNKTINIICPRFIKNFPLLNLQLLNSSNCGQLVSVRGKVSRIGNVDILCTWMAFKCPLCGHNQAIRQTNKTLSLPFSCQSECRAKKFFTAVRSSPYTILEPFQTISLDEDAENQIKGSAKSQKIEVGLTQDLVDSVCPGDDVIITGVLKSRPLVGIAKTDFGNYSMYIKALGITNSNEINFKNELEFNKMELEAIQNLSEDSHIFKLLVQSLCPDIYGQEMVKAGIILALFGGTGTNAYTDKINVLLVSNPGLGKTQILRSAALNAPIETYIPGNQKSVASKLNAKIRKEKGTIVMGASMEAGALVMADKGICCIDDIETTNASQFLIQMMDQHVINSYNSNIYCQLHARTSIIVAANPNGGHYNRSKTVSQNVRLNPALLSKFDLIFIIFDKPSQYHDKRYTDHVNALGSGSKKKPAKYSDFKINPKIEDTDPSKHEELDTRLTMTSGENIDLIPNALMKKYIAYAKKNIDPLITSEAADILKNYFVDISQKIHVRDNNTVTSRHLHSLIHLTQARARLELKVEATAEHAKDVISIIRYSLIDQYPSDAPTERSFNRFLNGSNAGTLSQSSQVKRFLKIIELNSNSLSQTIFDFDELKDLATNAGITGSVTQLIEIINLQGFLLKKGNNVYEYLRD